MAEKKRGKKRKEEYVGPGEEQADKPAKEEYSVAKWLRKNVPIKRTKFLNHNVEYFTASRAVDALLESSQWGKGENPKFPTREAIVEFMDTMLRHKFFHRAKKVPISEQELKGKKKDKKKDDDSSKKEKESTSGVENVDSDRKDDKEKEKEKKKRKIRLDMHNDQQFVDGLDAYVWIYDPIPIYYWFFGALLVLGATGICLFPLWPPSVRKGVYYLSVAAAGFLVFIVVLAALRFVIFCLIWLLTLGKHHLWLLPNLTEDVGFFASFWPLYKYEYKGGSQSGKKGDKKKKKKDKDSDAEEDERENEEEKLQQDVHKRRKLSEQGGNDDDRQSESAANTDGGQEEDGGSESESESSQRSSTGRDFEMVDQDELES